MIIKNEADDGQWVTVLHKGHLQAFVMSNSILFGMI